MIHTMYIKDHLKILNIEYEEFLHPPVYTFAEAKEYRDGMETVTHAKNLFLKDSKTQQYYLVTLEAMRVLKLKDLRKLIKAKKLSFASSESLHEILKLEPGSVSPFGLINDDKNITIYIIDEYVWESDKVAFHPNINTETLVLSGKDFQRYVKHQENRSVILRI